MCDVRFAALVCSLVTADAARREAAYLASLSGNCKVAGNGTLWQAVQYGSGFGRDDTLAIFD